MEDCLMRGINIFKNTALSLGLILSLGVTLVYANEGADTGTSSASLSKTCTDFNKSIAEGSTPQEASAELVEAGDSGDVAKDINKLKLACMNLGVPLKALGDGGTNTATNAGDQQGAKMATDALGKLAGLAGGSSGGGGAATPSYASEAAQSEAERHAEELKRAEDLSMRDSALTAQYKNDADYGNRATTERASSVGAQEAAGGVRVGSTDGFRSEAAENITYNQNLDTANNTLSRSGLGDAVAARQGLSEKFGENSAQVAGFDEGIRQATKNVNTQSDGSMGLSRADAGLDRGADIELARGGARQMASADQERRDTAIAAADRRVQGLGFTEQQNKFYNSLSEDQKNDYSREYNKRISVYDQQVKNGTIPTNSSLEAERNNLSNLNANVGWWERSYNNANTNSRDTQDAAYRRDLVDTSSVRTESSAPASQAPGGNGTTPRYGSATEDDDKRIAQSQARPAEPNREPRLVEAPQPPARPADLTVPQGEWSGGNLPKEQQNSQDFQQLNSYFAKNGDEETAKIFAESKNMNELTRRLGARDGEFSAAELNAIPANQRQNYLEAGLELPQGSLAPNIVQAAQAGKLTDAQLEAIQKLPTDGTAGSAINQILSANSDQQRTPNQTTPVRDTDTSQNVRNRNSNNNNTQTSQLGNALQQAAQQLARQQQQQQQQNPYNTPYNNQYGNQYGNQCPTGTQLTYYNGQQACISTSQGQCPVGTTSAYSANTSGGLFGVGSQQQLICIPTGTAGNTCPTGQVPSVQANGITVCVTQTATNEATVREQAGYLDGVRVKDGVCGLGIDSRFSTDSNYLAGYNRGQAECRSGSGTTTTAGTTKPTTPVTKTNTNRDVSDARARAICQEQIGNVSKELKDTKGLFTLLFRERGTLSEAEKTALGFDETIEKRLTAGKNQFDAGKADAVSIRDLDSDRQDNVSYREGYACGRKML